MTVDGKLHRFCRTASMCLWSASNPASRWRPQSGTVIDMRILTPLAWLTVLPVLFAAEPLAISTFSVDATPPLGAPLEMGACKPALEIVDPLSARGIVL